MKAQWAMVIAVTALFLASGALAQRPPAQVGEQRVALVIGNAAYKEAPLRNPVNDATDMARALREMGFAVTLRTNATHKEMEQAIQQFGLDIRRGGVGLFFFAGHGIQSSRSNYLVPIGANIQSEADLKFQSVDSGWVLAQMEDARNRVNIVVLDACRNNPYARSFRSAARGLAIMDAAKGSFIAFATAPGDVAQDGAGRNGTYTKHLLASLRHPDSDIFQVFSRAGQAVAQETKEQQIPWFNSSLTGRFQFRSGTESQVASVAPSTAAIPAADPAAVELAFWDSIKTSTSRADFEEYLRQYPDGHFAGLARNRLKSLAPAPPAQVATIAPSTPAPTPAPAAALADSVQGLAPGTAFKDCDVCPEMVVVPAGSFMMGSPQSEQGRDSDEGPQHPVTISRQFAAGKYEVTFDEWDACVRERGCGHNPTDNGWGRGQRPVINVSWQDAKAYAEWLSSKTGRSYRLLTEAEWEYAARAGTMTAFSTGMTINPTQANYDATSSYAGSVTGPYRQQTVPVGSFQPNAFGLYDVHGNVWEWTEDCWNGSYNGAPSDGSAWTSGDCGQRVLRGGSWFNNPWRLRSAYRLRDLRFRTFTFGFRVARTD